MNGLHAWWRVLQTFIESSSRQTVIRNQCRHYIENRPLGFSDELLKTYRRSSLPFCILKIRCKPTPKSLSRVVCAIVYNRRISDVNRTVIWFCPSLQHLAGVSISSSFAYLANIVQSVGVRRQCLFYTEVGPSARNAPHAVAYLYGSKWSNCSLRFYKFYKGPFPHANTTFWSWQTGAAVNYN